MSRKLIFLKSNLGAKGGLEKYTLRLANAFVEKGFHPTLLTSSSKKRSLPKSDLNIKSISEDGFFSYRNLIKFDHACNEWLSKNKHDIVFGLDRNTFQTHYRAGNGVHAAYLAHRRAHESKFKNLTFKFNPLHHTILKYEKIAFENPSLKVIFTNSFMVKNELHHYYNVDTKKVHVVHNGVEWHEFQEAFDATEYTNNPIELLFIGNGYKRKGLLSLLEALDLANDRSIHLSVIGKDKEQKFFENIAKSLRLNVTFHGPKQDIRPFYQKADCVVIPSLYDPFANVTVEALAMGNFVLSSKFNGGSEILHKETGKTIENPFDLDSFAQELKLLKKKTKESAALIREMTRKYDFKNQLQKIIDITLQ